MDKLVDDSIIDSHNALRTSEGTEVTLDCRNNATKKVMKNFLQATYRWIHNGMHLKFDEDRVLNLTGRVVFLEAKAGDSGSYLCQIEYAPFLMKTVAAFSLLVIPNNILVQTYKYGARFCLKCNSDAIGHLYLYTSRNWIINDLYYALKKDVSAKSVEVDCIDFALSKMSGDWTCVTTQEYTKKQWSTAFYRIIVDDEPPFTAKLAIFLKDNILHLIVLMVGIVLFVVSYIVAKKRGKFARGPDGSIENAPLVPEPKL